MIEIRKYAYYKPFDSETILYIMPSIDVLVCYAFVDKSHTMRVLKERLCGPCNTKDSPCSTAMADSTELCPRWEKSKEGKHFNSRVTISSISEITRDTRFFSKIMAL